VRRFPHSGALHVDHLDSAYDAAYLRRGRIDERLWLLDDVQVAGSSARLVNDTNGLSSLCYVSMFERMPDSATAAKVVHLLVSQPY
jgi:hypothetical protein